jgi:hypothetical protein
VGAGAAMTNLIWLFVAAVFVAIAAWSVVDWHTAKTELAHLADMRLARQKAADYVAKKPTTCQVADGCTGLATYDVPCPHGVRLQVCAKHIAMVREWVGTD